MISQLSQKVSVCSTVPRTDPDKIYDSEDEEGLYENNSEDGGLVDYFEDYRANAEEVQWGQLLQMKVYGPAEGEFPHVQFRGSDISLKRGLDAYLKIPTVPEDYIRQPRKEKMLQTLKRWTIQVGGTTMHST